MEYDRLSPCEGEWKELSDEYISLQELHREYIDNLEQLDKVRTKFEKALNHQKYRLTCLETSLKKIGGDAADDKARKDILEKDVSRREAQLAAMAGSLPKKNGLYLSIILGSVNVSILNPAHRFQYKEEYEKFKVTVTLIVLAMAVFNLLLPHRVMDLIFMFLLVWYYCTLTIRESILRVNGSRIKGWWRVHHFLATVMSGVLLVWASSSSFQQFRAQFLIFNLYIGMVQYMQFVYQKGCLYRLKALGDRYTMDITIEGFHSWMWKGLSFLLPFLYVGYAFQLYNAYVLFKLSKDSDAPWPILVLSILFFIVFLGNAVTTSSVIPQKMWARVKREIKMRHTKLDKVSWKHSKSKSLSEERGAGDADASKQCSPEEKAEAKKLD